MDLTAEQVIELTLKPGAIYKYPDPENLNKNPEAHYHILLNNAPETDQLLIFVFVSSKVEQAKKRAKQRGQAQTTLVELKKKKHKFLIKNSIVDCNNIALIDKKTIINKYNDGKFELEKEIDALTLNELRKAFLLSDNHDNAQKRIIDEKI